MDFYKAIVDIRTYLIEISPKLHPEEFMNGRWHTGPETIGHQIESCNQMLTELENKEQVLTLNKEEALALKNFLLTCGYIDYENHGPVHEFYKRLESFTKC